MLKPFNLTDGRDIRQGTFGVPIQVPDPLVPDRSVPDSSEMASQAELEPAASLIPVLKHGPIEMSSTLSCS
jgi:hypothetical protein